MRIFCVYFLVFTPWLLTAQVHSPSSSNSPAQRRTSILKSKEKIHVMLPRDSAEAHVYNHTIQIYWIDSAGSKAYKVIIKNFAKVTIHTEEVTTSNLVFDFNAEKFKKEKVLYFIVSSITNPTHSSTEHVLKRISPTLRRDIEYSLNELSYLGEKALDYFILAGFFEERALYADAVYAYMKSIQLSEENFEFKHGFDIFLKRHGFYP